MSFGDKPRNNQNQKKPAMVREVLMGVHECDPLIEAIMTQVDKLQPFQTPGNALPTEMVRFDTPSGGQAIEAYKAMMIVNGFCVNLDNPLYPEIRKLKTLQNRSVLHAVYRAKITWKHSSNFWHIPCFTRYVINEKGNIKNAFNGLDITPNKWGSYELVADQYQSVNKPIATDIALLMLLSQKPLPAEFKDYGFRNYSHKMGWSSETQTIDLIMRPGVAVRDAHGNIEEANNISEFSIIYLKPKDVVTFREVNDEILRLGNISLDQFTIKLSDGAQATPAPQVQVNSTQVASTQPSYGNYGNYGNNTQQTTQQPSSQTAPPPLPTAFNDDIPF